MITPDNVTEYAQSLEDVADLVQIEIRRFGLMTS